MNELLSGIGDYIQSLFGVFNTFLDLFFNRISIFGLGIGYYCIFISFVLALISILLRGFNNE